MRSGVAAGIEGPHKLISLPPSDHFFTWPPTWAPRADTLCYGFAPSTLTLLLWPFSAMTDHDQPLWRGSHSAAGAGGFGAHVCRTSERPNLAAKFGGVTGVPPVRSGSYGSHGCSECDARIDTPPTNGPRTVHRTASPRAPNPRHPAPLRGEMGALGQRLWHGASARPPQE